MDSWDWGEDREDNTDIVCKYCDEAELTWVCTGTRWKLVDADGEDHVCRPDPVSNFKAIS